MPTEWPTITLGDVAQVRRGLAYVAGQLRAPGRPFVTLKCFERGGGFRKDGLKTFAGHAAPEFEISGGELLIANTDLTRDATVVGAPALAPYFEGDSAVFSMDVSRLVTDARKVENGFLALRLAAQDARSFMQARSGGSTVLHLQLSGVPKFRFQLPPLPEQRQIAAVLDTVDDAIRKTEQIIAKLKQVKQGLLHDLLTRGIDENGELRDPERHPEQFKDSPLGRIPREWETGKLGQLSELVTSGSRGWARFYAESGALFLRSQNVRMGTLDLAERQYVRVQGEEGQRTKLAACDLLITITGNGVGNVAALPDDWSELAFVSQHVGLVRLLEPELGFWTMHWLAQGSPGNQQIIDAQSGQSKPGLNLDNLRNFVVPIPPRGERRRILERLSCLQNQTNLELSSVASLRGLKAGLMQDLLTGRVRVTSLLAEMQP